jgi:hypothetical protein
VTPGQRLRLLAYLVRDQEVDGSNPFAPTIFFKVTYVSGRSQTPSSSR